MITTQDIQFIISLAILNNKPAFINAMRTNGYTVPAGITDDALNDLAQQVLAQKGADGIAAVLNRVPPNKAQISDDIKAKITAKFGPADATQRGFGDWFNDTVNFFGDLIGGTSTSSGSSTSTQSTSALSPAMLSIITVVAVVLMIIFRKSIALVIAMIVVVFAVVMYGIFAKNVTSTTTGGTTQSHGGIGSILLGWLGL